MEKLTYTTPVVEVTKWVSQDIITTSGTLEVAAGVANLADNDDNYTRQVLFGDLK